MDFARLFAPFPPDRVSWRIGTVSKEKMVGMALAYIDARDVMERLDEVCGPAGWQCSYPHANGKTVCRIEIKIGGEWVGKEDGAGDTDVEAEKGALSDAFKRAAVRWGIGRYLYDLPSPWVQVEAAGKSYRITEAGFQKLEALLKRDAKVHAPTAQKPAEDDPFTDGTADQSQRARLIEQWRKRIANESDVTALGAWWNGDQRKKECHDFGLTAVEILDIKNAVVARKAFLEGRAAA